MQVLSRPVPRTTPPPCPRPAERRREPRWAAVLPVDLATPDGAASGGTTLDLSLGGLCVEASLPLRAGTRVELTLRLPAPAAPVRTDAVVRWVRATAGGLQLAGLGLPPLPTRDREAVRRYLESLG